VTRVQAILQVDILEEQVAFDARYERWRHRVGRLKNTGCQCCVDIYEFDASQTMLIELEQALERVGTALNRLSE
jgi:hypothetical protein